MANPNISPCGIDCAACEAYPTECASCRSVSGAPYWVPEVGIVACPLYECVVSKHSFSHCGECPELPCQLYYDTRDPSMSDEAFEASVQERVQNLQSL